jgi:hypothetical protein
MAQVAPEQRLMGLVGRIVSDNPTIKRARRGGETSNFLGFRRFESKAR